MNARPEIKFLAAFGMSVGVGFLIGSTVLGVLVGTCLGLVWGYTDTLLGTAPVKHTSKVKATKTKKKKSSKRRKK